MKKKLEPVIEKVLSVKQIGFRKKRNTMDALVRLENEVKLTLKRRKSIVAVFYDLQAAFDSIPFEIIVSKLGEIVKGKTLGLVLSLLKIQSNTVKADGEASDEFQFQKGVPQGAILSPLIFNLVMADFPMEGTDGQIFADDVGVWVTANNVREARDKMQKAVEKVNIWAMTNKLTLSDKTVSVIFCNRSNSSIQVQNLSAGALTIPFVPEAKYLGVVIDSKFRLSSHIENVIRSAKQVINLMKCLAGKNWGADRSVLKTLYEAGVRTKLEYAAPIMMALSKKNIKKLETVQNSALRIITGGLKTTPVPALRMETGVLSMNWRIKQLGVQYSLRIASVTHHPNQNIILQHSSWPVRDIAWKNKPPHAASVRQLCKQFKLPENFLELASEEIQREKIKAIDFETNTIPTCKREDPPAIKKSCFLATLDNYKNHKKFYTDGSKGNNRTGMACLSETSRQKKLARLDDETSVFDAEMLAIITALDLVANECQRGEKAVIVSDSKAAIEALKCGKGVLSDDFYLKSKQCADKGLQLTLQWCPSHCDIAGNEEVDKLAKEATKLPEITNYFRTYKSKILKIRSSIRKAQIIEEKTTSLNRYVQNFQGGFPNNKLIPVLRKEATLMFRMRTEHCCSQDYLYRIQCSDSDRCECNLENQTINHLLERCPMTTNLRTSLEGILLSVDLPMNENSVLFPPTENSERYDSVARKLATEIAKSNLFYL